MKSRRSSRTGSRSLTLVIAALAFEASVSCVSLTPGGGAVSAGTAGPSREDAFAVVAEVDRLAAADLWPGFDPRAVPIAIYDGERTVLFRHPAPPEGFQPVAGHPGVWAYPGRYADVTANTSVELGGARTATLMPPAADVTLCKRAGVLIHEAFHVFQRERHPKWSANEAELFTYPVEDTGLLTLRRLESAALRRALMAPVPNQCSCWARIALDARRERYAVLSAGSVAYERGTEWNEGLAAYVERRACHEEDGDLLPEAELPPEAVRLRGYATGPALGRVLDRFSPAWRSVLERNDSTALDALLAAALAALDADAGSGKNGGGAHSCDFTRAERDAIGAAAASDVEALRARLTEQRRDFLQQPGWTLVLYSGAPLFPQGFDPLNVQRVGASEVLHMRWLKLGNERGSMEVLGRPALTEAAGAHPLFNGVRKLTLTGLAKEPGITEASGTVAIKADGVSGEFRGASVERTGRIITVRIAER